MEISWQCLCMSVFISTYPICKTATAIAALIALKLFLQSLHLATFISQPAVATTITATTTNHLLPLLPIIMDAHCSFQCYQLGYNKGDPVPCISSVSQSAQMPVGQEWWQIIIIILENKATILKST